MVPHERHLFIRILFHQQLRQLLSKYFALPQRYRAPSNQPAISNLIFIHSITTTNAAMFFFVASCFSYRMISRFLSHQGTNIRAQNSSNDHPNPYYSWPLAEDRRTFSFLFSSLGGHFYLLRPSSRFFFSLTSHDTFHLQQNIQPVPRPFSSSPQISQDKRIHCLYSFTWFLWYGPSTFFHLFFHLRHHQHPHMFSQ